MHFTLLGEAMDALHEELKTFSEVGLHVLKSDLQEGRLIRGSWAGCPLSYKHGAAGSSNRDCRGRARNDFTILWDNEHISRQEVIMAVSREIERRAVKAPVILAAA